MTESDHNPAIGQEGREPWLCSHLVRLFLDDEPRTSEIVQLEEISADGVGVAVESVYPKGLRLTIGASGFEARIVVASCQPRETGFRLEARFSDGFRWSPEIWRPDHLFRPPSLSPKAKGAAGGS
jgi:hypothetical protein